MEIDKIFVGTPFGDREKQEWDLEIISNHKKNHSYLAARNMRQYRSSIRINGTKKVVHVANIW